MQARIEPTRGVRGKVAAIGMGALLAAASLVPATAAQAVSTTTVHGTVQSGAAKLAGVPVGFWSRTGHKLAGATTGASGAFTLHVPSGVRGFAYAGPRPDATKAIFTVAGRSFVRGVIGAGQGATTSYRIYQGHASATAARLAAGSTLRFRLQKPGRISVHGGSPFHGAPGVPGIIDVQRLNGSAVQRVVAGRATGTATSKLLVPGSYRIHLLPQLPYLPRTVSVTVPAGSTGTVSPTFTRGATLSGVLTGPGSTPAAGVPVTARLGTRDVRSDLTDASGRYSIPGLATGSYSLRIGTYPPLDPEVLVDEPEDPDAVHPPTSNDYLPRTVPFSVDTKHHDLKKNGTLAKAGHVRGAVTGATGPLRVWLETTGGRIIRIGNVPGGKYEFGGLTPGTSYRVYAGTASNESADSSYGEAALTATSSTQTKDITVARPTLTLKGSVTGGRATRVSVDAVTSAFPPMHRRFESGAGSTAYTVRGLIPGQYTVTVNGLGARLPSRARALTLTPSQTTVGKDYAVGPLPGTYAVRFVSVAAPIPHVGAQALDRAGDVADITTSYRSSANRTGRAVATGLWAGTYRYSPSSFAHSFDDDNIPVVDGPWWFGALSSTFAIRAGRTTNDGTIALHVHAR